MTPAARISVACLALAAPALADGPAGLGERAQSILTAENLFGSLETDTERGEDRRTSLTQKYMPGGGLSQLGYHRVVAPRVTLGANLHAYRVKIDDADSASWGVMLRPRVGYALPLSPLFAVWPRGGLLLAHGGGHDTQTTALAAGVDALVALTPAPHVGIFGGLLFEAPLWGRHKTEGRDSQRYLLSQTGLTVGALVDF